MLTENHVKTLALTHIVLFLALGVVAIAQPATPSLTELERTRVELLQVRTAYAQLLAQYDACKAEVGATFNALGTLRAKAASTQLTEEEAALKALVEKDHVGYTWDPKTLLFTKTPDPATVTKKSGGS